MYMWVYAKVIHVVMSCVCMHARFYIMCMPACTSVYLRDYDDFAVYISTLCIPMHDICVSRLCSSTCGHILVV
jgi:hypothetical protein